MKLIKTTFRVCLVVLIITQVFAKSVNFRVTSKADGDITLTNTVKDVFAYSHYLAHILAYDTTKTDSVMNPYNSKVTIPLLTSATDIRSKVIDGINYEGRALVGTSVKLPKILIIIFRGTDNTCNGVEDARLAKVALTTKSYKSFKDAKVHEGFMNVYKSLREEVRKTVLEKLKADSNIDQVFITGHSLGGALANLCAVDMDHYYNQGDGKAIKTGGYEFNLVTFGSPRVGDATFANYVNNIPKLKRNVRIVHESDIVAQIPLTQDYIHSGTLARLSSGVWKLGEWNKDQDPRLEILGNIVDPVGLSSYAENYIDLVDCNTSAWEAFTKIASKLTTGAFSVFLKTFKIALYSSSDISKIVDMGTQHTMYKTAILPSFMLELNTSYETLAAKNGKTKKRKNFRK